MSATTATESPPTTTLAEWVATLRYGDLPVDVRQRTKDIFFDALANAYAGHGTTEIPFIESLASRVAGPGGSTVIGSDERRSAAGAVLINGYLITAVTGCDVHRPTTCHVTPQLVPPALAVGEELDTDGETLLVALAAGAEVTTRVGNGLFDPKGVFAGRGWHTPGIIGPFGGAAAAGRVMGLDGLAQRHAFGLAGSQAAGTYAQFGTPAIKFNQSRGALSGLLAATLASDGFTAATEILADPFGGLYGAYAGGGRPEATLDGLGTDWELMQISLRAYPCGVRLQSLVTGVLDVLAMSDIRADEIAKLTLGLPAMAYERNGEMPWDERFRARLSAPYVTGVVAMDGACRLDQFSDERISDPATNAFINERVVIEPDPAIEVGVTVSLTTRAGVRHETRATVAYGDPEKPLAWDDIETKFRASAEPIIGAAQVDTLIACVTGLESLKRLSDLTTLLRPA